MPTAQLENLLQLQIRDDDRRMITIRRDCTAAQRELDRCADVLHTLLGSERVRILGDEETIRWNRTTREVLAVARSAALRAPYAKKRQITCALTAATAAEGRVSELTARLMRMETRFLLRGGWWRFYAEPDGVLHTNPSCKRLRLRRGQVHLVPHLSGTDAYEMRHSATAGELCSGCFSTRALDAHAPRGLQDAA